MAAGPQADGGIDFIGRDEQEQVLEWPAVLSLVEESDAAWARGEASLFPTLREAVPGGRRASCGSWPARGVLGVKVSGFFVANPQRGLDSHQSVIVLLDGESGRTRAIVDGNHVTWLRTAMAGLAATCALARPDARRVLIVGNGQQAEAQARAHAWGLAEREPESDSVHAPRDDAAGSKAARFAERLRAVGVDTTPVPDLESAIRGIDIVITSTPSADAVLNGEWVTPGTHVNAIGADAPGKRELDDVLLDRCVLVADDRTQCHLYGEGKNLAAERLAAVATLGEGLQGQLQVARVRTRSRSSTALGSVSTTLRSPQRRPGLRASGRSRRVAGAGVPSRGGWHVALRLDRCREIPAACLGASRLSARGQEMANLTCSRAHSSAGERPLHTRERRLSQPLPASPDRMAMRFQTEVLDLLRPHGAGVVTKNRPNRSSW